MYTKCWHHVYKMHTNYYGAELQIGGSSDVQSWVIVGVHVEILS